ncbi:MAG: FMN-binding protein [Symbiobacteriaceae bacterium]|nr:FMN-binding protein [Symbiobacteriaceae bacterium]
MIDLKDIARCTIILAAIGAVSGGSIAATRNLTGPIVEARAREKLSHSLSFAIPHADSYSEKTLPNGTPYYVAEVAGEVVGYIIQTTRSGYNPGLTLLTGLDPQGTILNVQVLSHEETPSIGGSKVINNLNFFAQFLGKGPTFAPEEIHTVSQATISSQGVRNAVVAALDIYSKIVAER